MHTLFRIANFRTVTLMDHSRHCDDKKKKYDLLKFIDKKGETVEIDLFYNQNTLYRVRVEMAKNENGRGPYKLPNPDGSLPKNEDAEWVFVDWHYEEPDSVIVIDAVWLDDERIDGNEEQDETLVQQIYEWELYR